MEKEDLELYELIAEDVEQAIRDPASPLRSREYRPVMVALAGYAVKQDEDDALKKWLGAVILAEAWGSTLTIEALFWN